MHAGPGLDECIIETGTHVHKCVTRRGRYGQVADTIVNDSTLKFWRGAVEAADAPGAGAPVAFADASLALTVPTTSIL